jgi:D-alanyl-D-alanine carboxypeptidase
MEVVMNKKSLLGLILFACLVISGMYLSVVILTGQNRDANTGMDQTYITKDKDEDKNITGADTSVKTSQITADNEVKEETNSDKINQENSSEDKKAIEEATAGFATDINIDDTEEEAALPDNSKAPETKVQDSFVKSDSSEKADAAENKSGIESFHTSDKAAEAPKLILDPHDVNYMKYIPEMTYDSELEANLDISNPEISIDAEAAILFDAETKKVLYYKNPVQAEFPASTAKLLTSIVMLEWCELEEEVTIGDEISMIASDSTTAGLSPGQILTIENLLEGMLLPSGNDAAYAVAAYVGRKSLNNPKASREEAVAEFVRLMNQQAKKIGVKNSCFKTPDGYDAIGQYTTAYDMGLIGIAASGYEAITGISQKSRSSNTFVSGEEITWNNTNKLVTRYSGQYYSPTIGLKTGTSTMAGRCLIALAEKNEKKVLCVVMDSTSAGRWEDAIAMLKYGLE